MDPSSIPLFLLYFLLILGCAYFAAAELAFSTVSRIRLRSMEDERGGQVRCALRVLDNFDLTLTTLLIGTNIMTVACAAVATILSARVYHAVLAAGHSVAQSAVTAVGTAITTVLIFILGEIIPKTYAKDNVESVALRLAGSVRFCTVLLYPLSLVFIGISKLTDKALGTEKQPSVTEEELSTIIENSEESGVLDGDEVDLLQSALEFSETTVADVLTLRDDVVWVDADATKEEIFAKVQGTVYSRLPVCRGSLDRCIGILRVNDFMKAYVGGTYTRLYRLMRKPFYTTLDASIDELKTEMSRKRQHIALVRDKSGKHIIGVVTIEDFLEELVGEIFDESDVVDDDFMKLGGNYFSVSGKLTLSDLFHRMNYHPATPVPLHRTFSTWILETLGRIPEEEDSFVWEKLTVEVDTVEQNRVTRATVKLADPAIDIEPAAPEDASGRFEAEKGGDVQ